MIYCGSEEETDKWHSKEKLNRKNAFTKHIHYKQDEIKGKFLSLNSNRLLKFRVFILQDRLPYQSLKTLSTLLLTKSWGENRLFHAFPRGIIMKWNANCLVQDLNLKNWTCVTSIADHWDIYISPKEESWNSSMSVWQWS